MDAIQGNISQIIERPVYPNLAKVAGIEMSFEPTEEQRIAYIMGAQMPKGHSLFALADLAQHAMAAALEAEHMMTEHNGRYELCTATTTWLRLADEKLREVKR